MNTHELPHPYVGLQELGKGAQGRVVLARHTGSSELVAIKILSPELLRDERLVDGFRREAELLAQVRDPHVAQVRQYLRSGDQAAIVMEAVNGVSLQRVLKEYGRLKPEAALVVLKGSLLGLDAAHQRGIIHRDYKPANVMVQENGQSKLIDFGISALAGERSSGGTPAYMAPEQWGQNETTPATDVYAATCVFYECVMGHRPFQAKTTVEMAARHLQAPVPLNGLPEELRELITLGMAKDPANRPPRALVLVRLLERVAANTYGPDWESRGLAVLAAGTAALAAVLPLASLILGSSTAQTGASIATTTLSGGAGKSGLFSKLGGGKAAAAGTVILVSGTICWLLLSGPDSGGTSTTSYEQWFNNAALLTGNSGIPKGSKSGPGVRYRLSATPAKAVPGTRVTLRVHIEARATWGLEYLSENQYRCHDPESQKASPFRQSYSFGLSDLFVGEGTRRGERDIWLYPAVEADKVFSTTAEMKLPAKFSAVEAKSLYRTPECAWIFSLKETYIFSVPDSVDPGSYLLSAYSPPGVIDSATQGTRSISLEAAGLRTEGRLPRFTVLG